MNQIAGVDGFNIMNNLRLVIIVALFIIIIIVLLLNWIIGSWKRAKRKRMQAAATPYDDSNREEQHAPGVVNVLSGMEAAMEKGKNKGGESTSGSEVEIEGQPVVNYEKIEADLKVIRDEVTTKIEVDLKAIRDEVTTKIEGLILKVEALETVEKAVLDKIEDVVDVKIQEASNKINDSLTEALRIQRNSITSVSEELVDSLCKEEEPVDILPSEDTGISEGIKEKEQPDTIVPSGEIEESILAGDVGESVDFDIQKLLEEEPVGISSTEESKELVEEKFEFEEKKEIELEAPVEDNDIVEKLEDPFGILFSDKSKTVAEEERERYLEVPSEVKEDVEVDKKEPIEAITSSGEIEEKISEGDVGESAGFDIQKLLEEEPVGISFTEKSREVVEEKVEFFKEEKERDLELPTEETITHEGIDEKEIDTITLPWDIKKKALETAKGEEAEDKKQSTGEAVDFDIQAFLEELGTLPSEKR
jgi:hypothetical protein